MHGDFKETGPPLMCLLQLPLEKNYQYFYKFVYMNFNYAPYSMELAGRALKNTKKMELEFTGQFFHKNWIAIKFSFSELFDGREKPSLRCFIDFVNIAKGIKFSHREVCFIQLLGIHKIV